VTGGSFRVPQVRFPEVHALFSTSKIGFVCGKTLFWNLQYRSEPAFRFGDNSRVRRVDPKPVHAAISRVFSVLENAAGSRMYSGAGGVK